ncbi:hypothetical protein AMEX_G11968 [Astyanax mexicanus]|uniref:Uncharacterized protein n=1 Tax=Astyanax mexicanus TaxID=7994 RepID=A0A8T2LM42_ASTMX|nr:hypothetical protein AMEX_G11968 [Astyanax mexicanus]
MLQQNNNNNYLCLDMAHRELLQGCSRTSAPLSFGAIGFGAIPLIKGLRAWAVSGGFTARSRRKSAGENHSHPQPDRHRGWKTKENLASFRTPGALVTVATLKGSEGARQTQTRCLFLKAEGCSYLCTVGNNRAAGPRAAGQRMHPKLVEGASRGRRVSQDDAGVCEVKPQVIRKWRKSSKVGKSTEKSSASERKGGVGAKTESFTSETDAPREITSATSDCAITQCLKAKHKHASSTKQSGTVNGDTGVNDPDEMAPEPEATAETSSGISGNSEVYVEQAMPRPHKDSLDAATTSSKHKGHLVEEPTMNLNHNAKSKGVHFASAVPKSNDFSPESEDLMQVSNCRNGVAEVEQNISQSYEESCLNNASTNPTDGPQLISAEENQEFKATADEDLPKDSNELLEVVINSEEMINEKGEDEGLVMVNTNLAKNPNQATSHGHDLGSILTGSKVTVENSLIQNENDQSSSNDMIEYDKGKALDVAGIKRPVENCERRPKARMDSDLAEGKNGQFQVSKARMDQDLGEGHHSQSEVPKAKMDHELIEGEKDQAEMVLYSRQMEKEDSPVENSAGELENNQAEVVICSKEMEKELETKSPIKDCDQGFDAVQSLQIQKSKDELLDEVTPKGPVEAHCQGHDPTEMLENQNENGQPEITLYSLQMEKDEALESANIRSPQENPGQGQVGPLEECSPPHRVQEVNSGFEEQWFAKSPSRGPSKASVAVSIACLPNPAFTSNSNSTTAIATAPQVLGRQEEVGAGFTSLGPQAGSQLLSEQERGQDWSKVATEERRVEVGEEEEDEFGVFMQAGEEQVWTAEFNRLQQVPSGTHAGIEHKTHIADANEPMSWTSDWTGVQSFHQSDDTWAAFKQEDDSKGAESEVSSDGQWWSSTAAKNTQLSFSSLHNVSNVFLAAFPSVDSSSEDVDYVPTLKELLQRPAENNRAARSQNQSLLDGLQDLDRMIDVKYKRAESLSRKLLLQSLHLGTVSSERVSSRKQATSRFSPNLPTSNQQLAANAKRRLSYDINRNITA